MNIHPRVTLISTHFNGIPVEVYFIRGRRNAIIDTGTPRSPQEDIAPALKTLGLTLVDIHLILNTHGHFDHAGGNGAVKGASKADLLLHREDTIFVEDHERCFKQYLAPAVEAIRGKEYLEEERANFFERAGPELRVDRPLEDNDLIDIGDGIELQVIHLPGHTSGSVGFYWEEEGILFSGDSLPGLHIEGGSLPVIRDLSRYKKSLDRIEGLNVQLLLCAHHYRGLILPPAPIKRGAEVREYLKDCKETAVRIGEAVRHVAARASEKPFMELAAEVMAELPKKMKFIRPIQMQSLYCAMTILSHLHQIGQERDDSKGGY